MPRFALITYDLVDVDDAARDAFSREMRAFGWDDRIAHTTTTMQRRFVEDRKIEDCFKISHNDLLLSCEKVGLTGKIRYVITVSPLAPIISQREFNQGEVV